MPNIVNLPTYEQSEQIKQAVESVRQNVNGIKSESITDFTFFDVGATTAISHFTSTVIEINGAGVILKLLNIHTSTDYSIRIQCDDGVILQQVVKANGFLETFMPFKTKAIVSINGVASNLKTHYLLK